MKKLLCLLYFITFRAYSDCVHERSISGYELESLTATHNAFISDPSGHFSIIKGSEVVGLKLYHAQLIKKSDVSEAEFESYNKRFIKYYRYQRIVDYLSSQKQKLRSAGHKVSIVGKSIKGRNLYGVTPIKFDPNKKTIIMFGRHHGDEGTANWIIEGFVDTFLKKTDDSNADFQLVLYPMINPDGAEAKIRYNDNGRDLNRSWDYNLEKNYDEAKVIHTDLKKYLDNSKEVPVVLDMHGSFTDDFIYRVKKNFISRSFFNKQQEFISELAAFDIWQNGIFKLSNGHKKMARLVLVKSYGLNSLTHETPRDIKLRPSRTLSDLKSQGEAIFKTVMNLYSLK